MPEGGECSIIANTLHRRLAGKLLLSLTVNEKSQHFAKKPISELASLVLPYRLEWVVPRGKKVVFGMIGSASELYLVSSLGMEGHIPVVEETLYFDDMCKYGLLDVCFSRKSVEERLSDVGPDLLNDKVSLETYTSILAKVIANKRIKKKPQISEFMMEQKYCSGMGAYIVAETLYRSKISPARGIDELTSSEIELLHANSVAVLRESYDLGGYTIYSYLNPEGITGRFVPTIYGQKSDSDGHEITKHKLKKKRNIQWCPAIQK
jgi:formamidopyrimidine-DNA glycosylase